MEKRQDEWVIKALSKLEDELVESFREGPINEEGLRPLNEELVGHIDGLKIEIFPNEHPPPHLRVNYAGETANYAIKDCQQINGGLSKWQRNIKKWHEKTKVY
jgi:hypothetical protein